MHVCVIVLQVVSTEITTTNHVSQFKSTVEFYKPMTTCLETKDKQPVRNSHWISMLVRQSVSETAS